MLNKTKSLCFALAFLTQPVVADPPIARDFSTAVPHYSAPTQQHPNTGFQDLDKHMDDIEQRINRIEQQQARTDKFMEENRKLERLSSLFDRLSHIINMNDRYIRDWQNPTFYQCETAKSAVKFVEKKIAQQRALMARLKDDCKQAVGPSSREYCQTKLAAVQDKIRSQQQMKRDFESSCKLKTNNQ